MIHDDYANIQRRLLDIYERGHLMEQQQFNQAVIELTGNVHIMVRRRRHENTPPVPPVAHPAWSGLNRMAPLRDPYMPPSPRRQVGPYTAPLRPVVRRNPLEKMVTIKKAEFDAICTDSCSICLEKHIKGDTIMTECNHEFGIQCYNSWMTAPTSNHKCPSCRKETPRVTMYKTRCRKPRPFIIEDEEEPVQELVGF
jgi:Ring finger domain